MQCCVNECPAAGNCYFSPQSRSSITTLDGETNKQNNRSGNKKKTYRTRCFKCSKHNNNKLAKLRRCASRVKLHGVVHGGRQGGRQGGQHGGWSRMLVNWIQAFRPEAYPTCEFILPLLVCIFNKLPKYTFLRKSGKYMVTKKGSSDTSYCQMITKSTSRRTYQQ